MDLREKRIREYQEKIGEIYLLEWSVSRLRDELQKLAKKMTQDDINEANIRFRKKYHLED